MTCPCEKAESVLSSHRDQTKTVFLASVAKFHLSEDAAAKSLTNGKLGQVPYYLSSQ